ncbi:MAG: hypothetical protein ABL958_05120, partial [Bdellovibrionia bacterium]
MRNYSLLLLITLVVVGNIGCNSPASNDSEDPNTTTTTQMSKNESAITASAMAASLEADLLNATPVGLSTDSSVVVPGLDQPVQLPPCVSLNPSSTSTDKIYDVDCAYAKGTLEFKQILSSPSSAQYSATTALNLVGPNDNKGQIKSDYIADVDNSGKVLLTRVFDHQFQTALSKFEVRGQARA